MGYYDNYLKRVNRYGNTLQERIQGKREHDFEVFMEKSPNKVDAWNNLIEGDPYRAVLQTKEYDQDEVVDYLLVPLENEIPMGTIIYTSDSRHKQVTYEDKIYSARRWINYAIDPYTSAGYNRYTVVELESELSWVDEGIKYTAFAHATGGGSGARDKNINLKFSMQFSEAGVYLPNKRYSIVMPTHPNIKKNMKVTLGGETWKVTGFDNISVKGVSYVTLEETLTDEREDIPVANYSELKNWTITTSLGDTPTLANETDFDMHFFYNNKEMTPEKFSIKSLEFLSDGITPLFSTIINGNKIKFISNTKETLIDTFLAVYLGDWDENDYIKIPIKIVSASQVQTSVITGTKEIYVGETSIFTVHNINDRDFLGLKLENEDSAEIIERDVITRTITIKGLSIGKNKLYLPPGIYSYSFEVKSMWLGGDS
jgi:hypothetical protein